MPELALLLLTFAWSTTFAIVKDALQDASTGVFLLLRFSLAALLLAGLTLASGPRSVTVPLMRDGLRLGAAMGGGFLLQTAGIGLTTPARAAFLTGMAVVFVPFLARLLEKRLVPARAWVAALLAASGLFVMTNPLAPAAGGASLAGDLLSAACAICFALQILWTSKLAPRHPLVPLTMVQVSTTALMAGGLALVEPLRFEPTARLIGSVAYTAIAMTVGALLVMNWAQRRVPAVRASVIFALEPVGAALFAWAWTGQPVTSAEWLGGALIVSGVLVGALTGKRGAA